MGLAFLLLLCSFLFIGQEIREAGEVEDIRNHTENVYVCDPSFNDSVVTAFDGILYKWADAFGFTMMEFAKGGVVYGFEHPEYDFYFFVDFVKWLLIIGLLFVVLSQLKPLILIFYFMGWGLKKLFSKKRRGVV